MYQRKVSYKEAIVRAMTTNYCRFSGRSSRSEFWWFVLYSTLLNIGFGIILGVILLIIYGEEVEDTIFYLVPIVNLVIALALFLPGLGLSVRRLHDIGKSGWYLLLNFIPYIGSIILIVWYCQGSQPFENIYGPIPNIES